MNARNESGEPPDETEELEGGNLSRVIRIGDTARRPAGPWTPAVHALLDHLAEAGFEGAPRALGIDAEGREILSYVPGETAGAAMPWPSWCWTTETLDEVGQLLRRFHDAVEGFRLPAGMRFRLESRALRPDERVCHNDVAPYNLVRRPDGRLALIDWDVAGPGHLVDDLAFAARAFAPLHPDAECLRLGFRELGSRATRLRRLLDAYGLAERAGFVDRIDARMRASIDRITAAAARGETAFARLIENGGLVPVHASRRWIAENREALERALA